MDSTHARHEAEYSDFGSVQEKKIQNIIVPSEKDNILKGGRCELNGGKKLFKFNIFFTEIEVLRTIMEN